MTRLVAPAKLNWNLEVLGRRPDGYHLLRSEMVSLALADELEIDESGTGLSFSTKSTIDVSTLPTGSDNLVDRALRLTGREAAVTLTKHIPFGGGLGGGSSDAAAVLYWSGRRDGAGALALGGDVPFCVLGGRALVEGVGEIVTSLTFAARRVTLLIAPFAVATAACYQAFDELELAPGATERNHLRVAAETLEPRLRELREWWYGETGIETILCGSGSTLFFEGWRDDVTRESVVHSPVGDIRILRTETVPGRSA